MLEVDSARGARSEPAVLKSLYLKQGWAGLLLLFFLGRPSQTPMEMVMMWLPRMEGYTHLVHWLMDEPVVMGPQW